MHKGAFFKIGSDQSWSYETALTDKLPDGRSVGNVTKYSRTTSKHQKLAGVEYCDVKLDNVPRGTISLAEYYKGIGHAQQV